ncbi:MAG: 16S rRNA (adenine(1518)-N(6)/adenine(1519)-N(6))-dimethyltransferase RsmA, partial [Candidatus Poribacteria bacterium]
MDYNSTQRLIKNLLKNAGIHPKKSLGQNFLIDQSINDIIIESVNLSSSDVIIELGAGLGILTRQIAPFVNKIFTIEFDPDLFSILQLYCKDFDNIIPINANMLEIDYAQLLNDLLPNQSVKVIGNLPYYITSPIIFMLLEKSKSLDIKSMVLMVQKEVGERIVSPPGNKSYGSLTVAVNYRCNAKIIKIVPADCFYPKPDVDSVIIRLEV